VTLWTWKLGDHCIEYLINISLVFVVRQFSSSQRIALKRKQRQFLHFWKVFFVSYILCDEVAILSLIALIAIRCGFGFCVGFDVYNKAFPPGLLTHRFCFRFLFICSSFSKTLYLDSWHFCPRVRKLVRICRGLGHSSGNLVGAMPRWDNATNLQVGNNWFAIFDAFLTTWILFLGNYCARVQLLDSCSLELNVLALLELLALRDPYWLELNAKHCLAANVPYITGHCTLRTVEEYNGGMWKILSELCRLRWNANIIPFSRRSVRSALLFFVFAVLSPTVQLTITMSALALAMVATALSAASITQVTLLHLILYVWRMLSCTACLSGMGWAINLTRGPLWEGRA